MQKSMKMLAAAAAAAMPVLAGCSSVLAGGGAGYDAGTLGVSGIETGVGGHAEAIGYSEPDATGYGLGAAVQIAGYSTDGDADPIAFTTVEARYRRAPGSDSTGGGGLYWEVGSGLGVAWSPGIHGAAVPLQGEVGVQTIAGPILLGAGVRERFLDLIGTGSPPVDAFNSVQLVARIGFIAGGRR